MSQRSFSKSALKNRAGLEFDYKNTWQRSSQWIALPLATSDEKVVALLAIKENAPNAIALNATTSTGQYTVDWGDGTSQNVNSGTTASKTYTFAQFDNSTLTSEGYKQVIVTITPVTAGALRNANFQLRHSSLSATTAPAIDWLEIKASGPGFINFNSFGGATLNQFGLVQYPMLENVEVLSGDLAQSAFNQTFNHSARNLKRFYFVSRTNPLTNLQMNGTFNNCFSLITCEIHCPQNFIQPSIFTNTFANCYHLRLIPNFKFESASTTNSAFINCYELTALPPIVFNANTDAGSMTGGCYKLKSLSVTNNTSTGYTIQAPNLETVDFTINSTGILRAASNASLTYAKVTLNSNVSGNQMFQNCVNLKKVDFSGSGNITNGVQMFFGCNSLEEVGQFNTTGMTSADGMFQNCFNLKRIGTYDFSSLGAGGIGNLIAGCHNLREWPYSAMTTTAQTSNVAFTDAYSIKELPPINLNLGAGNISSSFNNLYECERIRVTGFTNSFAIQHSKLNATRINEVIENLAKPASNRTFTITGAFGSNTWPTITKTSVSLTAGSTTFAVAVSNLIVGMQVLGTGISTARSVTFQDLGDTVTLTAHGIPNGKRVSFSAITSTTGITTYVMYFVVNATTDTFQLSLTDGGSPISLTTDGSGTMLYQTLITAIDTNNNIVTVDVPASASGTVTLSCREIFSQIAIMKNWTVAG
jgi:hypothetical protein